MSRRQLENQFAHDTHAQEEHSELVTVRNTQDDILAYMSSYSPDDLYPPADAVLAVSLERATGVRVI